MDGELQLAIVAVRAQIPTTDRKGYTAGNGLRAIVLYLPYYALYLGYTVPYIRHIPCT